MNGILGINAETVSGGYRSRLFSNGVYIERFRVVFSSGYGEDFEGTGEIKELYIIEDKNGNISGLGQLIL